MYVDLDSFDCLQILKKYTIMKMQNNYLNLLNLPSTTQNTRKYQKEKKKDWNLTLTLSCFNTSIIHSLLTQTNSFNMQKRKTRLLTLFEDKYPSSVSEVLNRSLVVSTRENCSCKQILETWSQIKNRNYQYSVISSTKKTLREK